jgi:hypothetical protein
LNGLQLEAWRSYVDANLLHTLVDRVQYKETKGGGDANDCSHYRSPRKICSGNNENYLSLLEVVDDLRNKEEAKNKRVKKKSLIVCYNGNKTMNF